MRWIARIYGFLFLSSALWAQQPFITRIINDASGDPHFSPGVLTRILGSSLPKAFSVTVNGKAAVQTSGDSTVARFQFPVDAVAGPTTLIADFGGGKSQQFAITLDPYAPAIFLTNVFYPLHSGDPHGICNLFKTTPGGFVVAIATGLGATNPPVATGVPSPDPPVKTAAKPFVTIDGQAVEVLQSVLLPFEVGVYQIMFRAPTTNGFHSVRIAAGSVFGNEVILPINAGPFDTHFSAATFVTGEVAPESLMVAYACDVASPLSDGSTAPLISVTDSHQAVRAAPLVYFNKYQANYVLPPGTASGLATVSIQKANGSTSTAVVDVSPVGPGLFSGFLIVRVANGTQTVTPDFATIDVAEGRGNSGPVVPIDLSSPGDVFLTLFTTGLRFRSALANVKVTIQGLDAPVSFAGAQASFPGLDQVNIQVPKTLQGIADAALVLTVDGIPANTMHLRF